MVRIIIKGGVWRNTEDEILKAAISKYGKNQWARISSLLVRKTPKQCKARWYEWLDPSIKKVEWSKTEDEKLLHLAKLMPTQWRTIAPIVGRTATQCLERYQKLLDEAEAKDNAELGLGGPEGPEGAPALDDIRRMKPGDIDLDQETKPARPDPIDMDEDEKEMLSEARARLANTQGKKAKRKARERQLEEARRLAVLQKKRELKAAGIILRSKPKKQGMDYNADIPFNKQPAPGFYDVSEENAKKYVVPVGQSLRQLEGKRRQELEELDEKKKRQKKNDGSSNQNTQFIAAREAQIQKLKETEQIIKRRKLNLPQPQVAESELETIVKVGVTSRSAVESATEGRGESGAATEKLLGEYDSMSKARMARTPRTAPQEDTVMSEARNLRNMSMAQTPLLGDENTPMHGPSGSGTGFEGATPRHAVSATPNPLATPFANRDVSATPRSEAGGSMYTATPMRTPMRDSLSINQDGYSSYGGDTPREQRLREMAAKRALQAGFAALPKPENDFEVDAYEGDEEEEAVELSEEDAAERDAKLKALAAEEERKALARRSAVVKLGLPRPVKINLQLLVDNLEKASLLSNQDEETSEVHKAIDYELAQMMLHDAIAHPLPGSNIPVGTESSYDMPDDEYVELARAEIHRELAGSLGLPGATVEQLKKVIGTMATDDEDFSIGWNAEKEGMAFSSSIGQWVPLDELSVDERIHGMSTSVNSLRERMIAESSAATKAEKKLAKQLGGYEMINSKVKTRISTALEALETHKKEFETFSMLRSIEEAAGPRRLEGKRTEVEKCESRERDLQNTYRNLSDERRSLMDAIAQLEEDKQIAEAQAAYDEQERAIEEGADEVAVDDAEMTDM